MSTTELYKRNSSFDALEEVADSDPNSIDAPVIPVCDGFRSKRPISLNAYVLSTTSLEGRDKFTKMVQYTARFLSWYLKNMVPYPGLAERAFELYRTTRFSRKAFRLFKVADEIDKIRGIVEAKSNLSSKDALSILRAIFMGLMWSYDNLFYLATAKTLKFGAESGSKGYGRYWTFSSLVMGVLTIQSLKTTRGKQLELVKQYQKAKKSGNTAELERIRSGIQAANAAHFSNWLGLLKVIMDLICSINMPGMDIPLKVFGLKLNDGVIGASGMVSALVTMYNCWPEKKKV